VAGPQSSSTDATVGALDEQIAAELEKAKHER